MLDNNSYRNVADSCADACPPEDFEGVWIEHWPNGQLKFRGTYKKRRMRVGQQICFWENGVLKEVSYWEQGWVTGTLIRFYENGVKECERDFGEYGGVTRSWTERGYNSLGVLSGVYLCKDDQIISRWARPDLRAIEEEIGMERLIEEQIRKLYPDD